MDAAFMSFQQHESGIHAVWCGTGGVRVTKVRFHIRVLPYRNTGMPPPAQSSTAVPDLGSFDPR
jgi:hypothetical protein